MKPIKLEIEGLNSFETKQVLDFGMLGDGVFGIFGKTGSGKSTILDAMTLALYGKVERSKQNIDFINTKCKKTIVSFEFEIYHKGKNRRYLITREFNAKKNGKDVESSAKLYEFVSGEIELIEEGVSKVDAKIFLIMGLGVNEFAKCIALPQGEFSAFLKARPAERTEIMSNIFDLSKYGEKLASSVKEKLNEYDKQIASVSSGLEMVQYATDDALNQSKKEFDSVTESYNLSNKELESKKEKYAKSSTLLEKKLKLNEINEKLEKFEVQKPEIEQLSEKIVRSQNANEIRDDHEKLEKAINDEKELSDKLSNLNEIKLQKESEVVEVSQEFEDFKKVYEAKIIELNSKLARLESLNTFADELNSLHAEEEKTKLKLSEKQKQLASEQEKLNYILTSLNALEEKINGIDAFIETNKPDADLAIALEQTKGIESELILIDEFYKNVERLIDQTNEDLASVQEEYNSAISEEKQIKSKREQIQNSIEVAFEDSNSNSFNKLRSCDKQLEGMTEVKISVDRIDENISKIELDTESRMVTVMSLDEQIDKAQNDVNSYEQEIVNKEREIASIRETREEILGENVVNMISNELRIGDFCPVCNNRVIQRMYNNITDLGGVESELETASRELKSLRFERDKNFTSLMTLKARYEFEKAQIEINKSEIEAFKENRTKLFQKYVDSNDKQEENFYKLKKLIENASNSLEQLLDLQTEYRQAEQRVIVNKTQSGAKITIYKNYLENLLDIIYDLQKKRAEREFVIFNVNEKCKSLKEYKKQIAEGKNIELIIDSKREEKYKLRENQIEVQNEKSETLNHISETKSGIDVLNEKLSNIAKQINNLNSKILASGVPEGVSVEGEREDTKVALQKLKFDYDNHQIKLESCKENLNRTNNDYNVKSSILSAKRSEIIELKTKVENAMLKYSFSSKEELEENYMDIYDLKNKQTRVNDFNNEYKLLLIQKESVDEDGVREINETSVLSLKEDIESLTEKVKELSSNVGKASAEYNRLASSNVKFHELSDKLSYYKNKYDTAKELSSVLKGKALAEYVAEEYLEEITSSANEKLSILMDGRYVLKFVDKEFFVEDNFNDAMLRPASTLSGGETFLVSLSLALSISDAIALLSSRNMNFFFLDEGFGTLDAELCSTVVDALYKLESQNLKIGLITHIAELEEAIKNKVHVTKTSSGSKLSIVHTL